MDEVRKEAGEPISGSVLLEKLSTTGVSDLAMEYSPRGKWKLFALNAGREVMLPCVANGEKGTVGHPGMLVHPGQSGKFRWVL